MKEKIRTKTEEMIEYSSKSFPDYAKDQIAELIKENEKLKTEIEKLRGIEKALQESEALYRARFEESPISLWDKDYSRIKDYVEELRKSGVTDFRDYFDKHPEVLQHCATLIRVTDVNWTTVRMYKAKDKEDFKNNLHKIFCDETWNCFKEEVLYVADGRNKREAETITQKFDGEKNNIVVKWQISSQYEGTYSRILFSISDVTKQKQAEKALRENEMKLIHANKMASLGTLVSGVAHEINNPNHYIMSNTELFHEIWNDALKVLAKYYQEKGEFYLNGFPFSEIEDVVQKLLYGVHDGTKRIKNIVDNLRNFSKPERTSLNGKMNVNEAVVAAASILEPQIKKYTDNFHIDCADDVPVVCGSSQQIEQVIINLLMNSLQALPDKNCEIQLSTSKGNGFAVIEVRDEGVGMPEDIIERITEPFFSTKLDSGGTGLGLSISYAIVKEHKGSLEFKSTQGKGTTAYVKLPVYEPI